MLCSKLADSAIQILLILIYFLSGAHSEFAPTSPQLPDPDSWENFASLQRPFSGSPTPFNDYSASHRAATEWWNGYDSLEPLLEGSGAL